MKNSGCAPNGTLPYPVQFTTDYHPVTQCCVVVVKCTNVFSNRKFSDAEQSYAIGLFFNGYN